MQWRNQCKSMTTIFLLLAEAAERNNKNGRRMEMGGFGKQGNGYLGNDDMIPQEIADAALAFERVRDWLWMQLMRRSEENTLN